MTDKKHVYESNVIALPPLKMVLGEIPEPDPDGQRRSYRAFNRDKSEDDARNMVTKLIGHLQSTDK
jgi:hypothetical protein